MMDYLATNSKSITHPNEFVKLKNYIFGSTSAITTNICLIVGLGSSQASKLALLGALFTIAMADNISDSLGIHMYKEAEGSKTPDSFLSMALNFSARLLISASFILIVLISPYKFTALLTIVWGFLLLVGISYIIARQNQVNPVKETLKHLLVASCVVTASYFVGQWIAHRL
jgi:vacuolar iron transporter family protein